MKFQNPSMHGSEVMLCLMDGRTEAHTNIPEAICPSNFIEVESIIKM